jgi:hypothetical protein
MSKAKRVNQWIGRTTGIGFIPAVQVLPLLICFTIAATVLLLTRWNWLIAIGTFVVINGTWWALTRNKPVDFLEQFFKPEKWMSRSEDYEANALGIPLPPKSAIKNKKLPDGSLDVKGQFTLATYSEFRIKGREVGFYLLKNGNRYMAILGWDVEGQDPYIDDSVAEDVLRRWNQGLEQIPPNVDLKIYDDCTSGDDWFIQMQNDLYNRYEDRSELEYAMKASSISRYTDLCNQGQALKKRLRVFAKYRFSLGVSANSGKKDAIETFLRRLEPFIDRFRSSQDAELRQWEKSADAIWDTFLAVESILTGGEGFGLKIKPLSAQTLWFDDWYEFHNREAPKIPQLFIVSEEGLFVKENSSLHALSVLFQPEDGLPTQPQTERDRVFLPVKQIHKGFIRFDKAISYRAQGDEENLGQLRFFLNALRGTEQPIRNYRIVIELTPVPSILEGWNLDRAVTNAMSRQDEALKRNNWDAQADRQGKEAMEARDQLLDRNPLLWVSVGMWLDRESPELLARDITEVCRLFPTLPSERAWEVAEKIYFQSQPYYWEAFLANPHHRRQKYQSVDMLALLPLAQMRGLEKQGTMFLTQETAEPVFIDFPKGQNHAGIFATTRASKSIVLSDIIFSFFMNRSPVVVFDFPGPDGISTYTDLIELLRAFGAKAAYYDIRKESLNMLSMPDLSKFKTDISDLENKLALHPDDLVISEKLLEKREDLRQRLSDIRDKHIEDITMFIAGLKPSSKEERLIKSFVSKIYARFMGDPGIIARYEAAHRDKFGSPSHWQTPTLVNYNDPNLPRRSGLKSFLDFAEEYFAEYLAEKAEQARREERSQVVSETTLSTIEHFKDMLRGLEDSDLGKAISRPSTFDSELDLLVIAMTQVNSDFETSVYAAAGMGVLLAQALSNSSCGFIVDEGLIMFDFPSFSRACARSVVNGLKWGLHFIVAAQTIEKIRDSDGGDEIFKNLNNLLVGHIQEVAFKGIVEGLNFRSNMLRPFVTRASLPSAQNLCSNWYLKRNDLHILLRHYPSVLLLALCANNPPEKEARQRVFAFFQDDPLRGLIVFAEHYSRVVRQGQNLTLETDRFVAQLEKQFSKTVSNVRHGGNNFDRQKVGVNNALKS